MVPLLCRSARAALCAAGLVAALAAPAGAATFTVTKTTDSLDGACDADCSLREAVQAANADATQDTIALPAGQHQVAIGDAVPEGANASGDLDITNDVIVRGAGADRTVIRALLPSGFEDRVLDLAGANTDVELRGLAVTGGYVHEAGSVGGGIRALGVHSLLLDHVVLRGNRAEGQAAFGNGGNLAFVGNSGALTIRDAAVLDGRGAFAGFGGGLYLEATTAPVTVENTTFAGNTASSGGQGGAIYSNAGVNATFTNVTVVDNHMEGTTGTAGIAGDASGIRFRSSVVAGNTRADGTRADCADTFAPASDGGNVGASACGLTLGSDLSATDPLLGPRSGDPIPVFVPLAGSPAIDHAVGPCPSTDARDLPRPSGPACDSGAAELQVPAPPPPAPPAATPADTTAPTLVLPKTLTVDRARRRVTVPLRCPVGETRCSGTVRLTLTVRPKGKKRKPTSVLLGRSSFSAPGGASARVALTLNKAGRAALKGRASRRVTLSVAVADAAGNRRTHTAVATLVVAKPKPRR